MKCEAYNCSTPMISVDPRYIKVSAVTNGSRMILCRRARDLRNSCRPLLASSLMLCGRDAVVVWRVLCRHADTDVPLTHARLRSSFSRHPSRFSDTISSHSRVFQFRRRRSAGPVVMHHTAVFVFSIVFQPSRLIRAENVAITLTTQPVYRVICATAFIACVQRVLRRRQRRGLVGRVLCRRASAADDKVGISTTR